MNFMHLARPSIIEWSCTLPNSNGYLFVEIVDNCKDSSRIKTSRNSNLVCVSPGIPNFKGAHNIETSLDGNEKPNETILIKHMALTVQIKILQKLIVQANLNRDFTWKHHLLALRFNPATFWLGPSCQDKTLLLLSPINLITPVESQYLGGPSREQ